MTKINSIQALEICVNGCKHTCPYYNKDDCITLLKSDLLDAFKRQNAIIEELTRHHQATLKNLEEAHLDIKEKAAEIERLRQTYPHNRYPVCVKVRNGEIYTHTLDDYDWLIGDISAEAIKEFWLELQKTIIINNTHDGYMDFAIDWNCLLEDGNEIVKRMVGDGQ